jgi:hypothetical protein
LLHKGTERREGGLVNAKAKLFAFGGSCYFDRSKAELWKSLKSSRCLSNKGIPFDYAQGRLSIPLRFSWNDNTETSPGQRDSSPKAVFG